MNSTENTSTEDSYVPAWWGRFSMISACVLFILVALAVVGNVLTIAAVVKFRHLRERQYMLITSLAVADVLVGVAWVIFISSLYYSLWCNNAIDLMLITFPTTASHMHVLLMAVDRFIAIMAPFRYVGWMSASRIKMAIISAWAFALVYVLTFLPWVLKRLSDISCAEDETLGLYVVSTQVIMYLLVVCSIVLIYSQIRRVAKLQANKIHTEYSTTVTVIRLKKRHNSSDTMNNSAQDCQDPQSPGTSKATKYMIAVIAAYLVTWSPYFVVALAKLIKPRLAMNTAAMTWPICRQISFYLMLINSSVNAVIYAAYISEFRKAFKAILSCSVKQEST